MLLVILVSVPLRGSQFQSISGGFDACRDAEVRFPSPYGVVSFNRGAFTFYAFDSKKFPSPYGVVSFNPAMQTTKICSVPTGFRPLTG